jgi:hypothetical protein
MVSEAPHDAAATARAGRRLVWLGYVVMLAPLTGSIAVTMSRPGGPSITVLLIAVVGIWAGHGLVAYGERLRGRLGPGEALRPCRGLLALPFLAALVCFGSAIEHFGAWWLVLLPMTTYDVLAGAGLPQWAALPVTAVIAVPELFLAVALSNLLVVKPAQKVVGRQGPMLDAVRGLVKGFDLAKDAPAGKHKWNLWIGEPAPVEPAAAI